MQENNQSILHKKKNMIIVITVSAVILLTAAIIFIKSFIQSSTKIPHGDWNSSVYISDTLAYILQEDFDKKTVEKTREALEDFFISLYTTGTGIGFVSYDATDENYALRIIDSYGIFHTLSITSEDQTVIIEIDGSKMEYTIEPLNREG